MDEYVSECRAALAASPAPDGGKPQSACAMAREKALSEMGTFRDALAILKSERIEKQEPAISKPKVKALAWRTFCATSGNREAATPIGEYIVQREYSDNPGGTDLMWALYDPFSGDASTGFMRLANKPPKPPKRTTSAASCQPLREARMSEAGAYITFEVVCRAFGCTPDLNQDDVRASFFAVWALLIREMDAATQEETSIKQMQPDPDAIWNEAIEAAADAASKVGRPVGAGDGDTYIPGTSADAAQAIRALMRGE